MRFLFALLPSLCLLAHPGSPALAGPTRAVSDHLLAQHWAPIIFQDVADCHGGRPDFITRLDYDDDDLTNNWENVTATDAAGAYVHELPAHVYYAVIETHTHHYITYVFYHPRDWIDCDEAGAGASPGAAAAQQDSDRQTGLPLQHEHDLEGAVFVIRKNEALGVFRLMVTQGHGDLYYFTPDPAIGIPDADDGADCGGTLDHLDGGFGTADCLILPERRDAFDIDGRWAVFVESRKHAVGQIGRALVPGGGDFELGGGAYRFRGDDGIVYVPGETAETPPGPGPQQVSYTLIPVEESLWIRRRDGATFQLFQDLTTSRGIEMTRMGMTLRAGTQEGGAHAPWLWGNSRSCPECEGVKRGDLFLDPAHVIARHLDLGIEETREGFDRYLRNPYLLGDNRLDLIGPVRDQVWMAGEAHSVHWTTNIATQGTGLAPLALLELSRDGGTSWETLAANVWLAAGSWTGHVRGPASTACVVRLTAASEAGDFLRAQRSSDLFAIEGEDDGIDVPPSRLTLTRNTPNPGRSRTSIRFGLPGPSPVDVLIHESSGRRVRRIGGAGPLPAGWHTIEWDGRDDRGQRAGAGVYVYRVIAGSEVVGGRLVLLH